MIGIFDSGVGGITILKAVRQQLPQYSYLYLADSQHSPYGSKTSEEIYTFTRDSVKYLFQQGCIIIILACNSASSVALRRLQQDWLPKHYPNRQVLGILVPTIEQITGRPWQTDTKPISSPQILSLGILATSATVSNGAYTREIKKRAPHIKVIQQACPGLAEAIEQQDKTTIKTLSTKYINNLLQKNDSNVHAILLGCTHYDVVSDQIKTLLPPDVLLFKQPTIIATSLEHYLNQHAKLASQIQTGGIIVFRATLPSPLLDQNASAILDNTVSFSHL